MSEVCIGPLLTAEVNEYLRESALRGTTLIECSMDLGRSRTMLEVDEHGWTRRGERYPYLQRPKARTIYYWAGREFAAAARYTKALIKLVPTRWGPPTFEIDGIKMLPSEHVSPYEDARSKVARVQPEGKVVLDTCAGLGYFAAHCLEARAARVLSFEKNGDVLWLRELNPWSPRADQRLILTQADVTEAIGAITSAAVDAVLHDPPRFAIAGELYSQTFYDQLARVLRRRGKLFHYTGSPNRISSGRDLPGEVILRLRRAGFVTEVSGDGILAVKK